MNKFIIFLFLAIESVLFLKLTNRVVASSADRFVTIVNPVRISSYNKNPEESLMSEYSIVREKNLPATWLLTYDALSDKNIISVIKNMDNYQEFGIFLEVTKDFAKGAGVSYHDTGFWQHANSVFLSGYTQAERRILIDKVFDKYKSVFGVYPKSVGSWWTDSYSLSYMQENYGITANLTCSDQYSTDGYQIWGTPWQMPYYSSKLHAGIPAPDKDNKIDVVNIQWAARDPLNGYENSLYSTQDYLVAPKPQNMDYFKKLLDVYFSGASVNGFGQMTVGLEADLDPAGYRGEFFNQMDYVQKLKTEGVRILTMRDFSGWYRSRYSGVSPDFDLESYDILGTGIKSFWHVTPKYRIFYVKDPLAKTFEIKDLRIYGAADEMEPYYVSPNGSFNLSINTPAVIDGVEDSRAIWKIPFDSRIEMNDDKITIFGKDIKVPENLNRFDSLLHASSTKDGIEITFPVFGLPKDGWTIRGFSSEAIHFFKQKLAIFYLIIGRGWNYFHKVDYAVPQGEVYALLYLKSLPSGRTLVYEGECLQCSWHTRLKPPVFAGLKDYVKKFSGQPVIYNSSVFNAKSPGEAGKEFKKTQARYIYLVKFEDYTEKLPFSPGDLGIERIFSNANAEIWRVK